MVRTGVTVRNCKISGFFRGILAHHQQRQHAALQHDQPLRSFGIALDDDSADNLVKSNRVVAPRFDGINLGFGASGNMIVSNTLEGVRLCSGTASTSTAPRDRQHGEGQQDARVPGQQRNRADSWPRTMVVIENVSSGNGIGTQVSGATANTIARNTTDENEAKGIEGRR